MSANPSRRVTHQARELENRVIRPSRKRSPWIAVSGGKGGVGKTLVAVNLAILMTRAGYRALLVDLDPGLANVVRPGRSSFESRAIQPMVTSRLATI